ncbi:4-hydroxythreonine-4-phosphate dehydrogenase [Formivibrio citricus]|uniref:4-hydroxythreonine-4-phosphate dehydrogenase n=1 Tax=Formivibrio citricus TaxID=83765 RepID=A0A1I5ADF4_9NEIS|nr:4-hydroxythreonine-4-phosphate dehydrogenase PdxA [Formivibrio citricus]SFN60447.1 4-hydroxythreonine-4-phosphate dehydrogenase [Formivibrio citricus]
MPERPWPVLALTTGEPAGVGPELASLLVHTAYPARLVLLGDRDLIRQRAGHAAEAWPDYRPGTEAPVSILHIPLTVPACPGQLDTRNAGYVLALLDRATEGCLAGEFDAMVTAPIHKGVINDAFPERHFYGHTEYLADKCGVDLVVMMLAGGTLRVALATTHLPLKEVPAAITSESLTRILRILHTDLRDKFGFATPRILVAGLNPHAGEGGHMGREEIDVIAPVLEHLRAEGMHLVGPLPADTLFTPRQLEQGDAVLAMYHDQGLPVLKYATFGQGINITLGLPIIRTSVDHGTALDLAGTGRADPGSLHAAITLAAELAARKKS